ncbi:thioredoxin family protein [Salinisphaera aquimarina]|uniref:Thioredoxin n=1 Tax=Salinisphaera aquimarina TaxID=2094031 RepID=A0ABV7ES96_9GAMM
MSDTLTDISDADFAATLGDADGPVLVEFYSSNCAYCRRLEPLLETAATDYAGRVRIVRMNAETNETRPRYGLNGTPTLVLYVDGEESVTKTGAMREQQLQSFLNAYV